MEREAWDPRRPRRQRLHRRRLLRRRGPGPVRRTVQPAGAAVQPVRSTSTSTTVRTTSVQRSTTTATSTTSAATVQL